MGAVFSIKQGATFNPVGQYVEDDGVTPKPLTGVTLQSQIRDKNNTLVSDLTITDMGDGQSHFLCEPVIGTQAWPVGTLYWDVLENVDGVTRLTNTVIFTVERAVTRNE